MSARIEVSSTAISEFKSRIQNFATACDSNAATARTYYDELLNVTNNLAQKTAKAIEENSKVIASAESKEKALERQLKQLERELKATPATITETYTDADGNTHSTTRTNPDYVALQREIGAVERKINKVESVIRRANTLNNQMQSEYSTLSGCMHDFSNCANEMMSAFSAINTNNSTAQSKLDKILRTVEKYLSTSIGGSGGWL